MNAHVVTGGIIAVPTDVQYKEMEDADTRAVAVAHLIRIGQRPPVGVEFGFSAQVKSGDASEVVSASGQIDHTKARAVSEKVWYQITVTQADIDAAQALINSQRLTYREEKTSQMMGEAS